MDKKEETITISKEEEKPSKDEGKPKKSKEESKQDDEYPMDVYDRSIRIAGWD